MPGEEYHQTGLKLFAQRQFEVALQEFGRAIGEEETCERWNDWASAELACGREVRAEWGYRRALYFDPANRQAAVNLAVLLIAQGRLQESVPLLAPHAPSLSENEKAILRNLIMKPGRPGPSAGPPPAPNRQLVLDAFLTVISRIPNDDPEMPGDLRRVNRCRKFDSRHYVEQCCELLKALPPEVQSLAIETLAEKSKHDYRLLLVLACHYLALNDPQPALPLAREAIEVRAYDNHVQRVLIQAELAVTPMESRAQHPRAGLEEYLAASFCAEPWGHLLVQTDGDVYPCCSGWLPAPIGNIHQSSVMEMWNSAAAQAVRKSILDGSFTYCSRVHCARIACRILPRREDVAGESVHSIPCYFRLSGRPEEAVVPSPLPPAKVAPTFPIVSPQGPRDIMLGHDTSCNLACPQCRRDFHYAGKEERQRLNRFVQDLLSSGVLKDVESLRLNESGEVFASESCRTLLKELKKEKYPKLSLALITNGQLCNRKAFDDLNLWRRLSHIELSIDAATEETYRVVRRGGDFKRLLANLEFLDNIRLDEGEKFTLGFSFVVSALNFREIPAFVELARRFHALPGFNFIRNHDTLPAAKFKELDISNPQHPDYAELLKFLEAEPLSDPNIRWGSLGHLRPRRLIPCAG
jgi:MoaA/NifB/PqqE/SkfB family radical SAM enzyme